jgi:hypothetical protein
MRLVKPSAIRELLRHGSDPSIMSFAGGYPDASLFPIPELARAFEAAIEQQGRISLQYTVSNGLPRLREQVAEIMNCDGVKYSADHVLILQGSQQGLDLVAKMFIEKGDLIVTESPTFLGGLIAFNPYEPLYLGVRIDSEGMDMDELERTLRANPSAKLLYTMPDFQNPTGVSMSLARLQRLIELAGEFDLIILEDTPYRELRFEGSSVPSLKSMDTEGRVVFLGSFSKLLAPGLRLGWAVASYELIQQLGLLKLAADTQCSTLNMSAVSSLLDTFDLQGHIATIRSTYLRKKNLMLDTIRKTFPKSVSFTNPTGGMFTWLTFPEGLDTARFMLCRKQKSRTFQEPRFSRTSSA